MTKSVDVMRGMAEGAGVRLEVTGLNATVCADPDRLIQVLTNLLSNAMKFSPSGTTVWLTAEARGHGLLRIEVRDQGRRIPADKLERVFERFQQVNSSDSRDKGGTGLGLPISRTIVEQHGGRMRAESTLGFGTTMIIDLPASGRDQTPGTL